MKKTVHFLFTFLLLLCFNVSHLYAEDEEHTETARILTSSGNNLYSASAIAVGKDDAVSYFLTSAAFIKAGSKFYIIPEAVIDEQGNYLDKDAVKVEVMYTDSTLNLSILKAENSVSDRFQGALFKSAQGLKKGDEIRSLGYVDLENTKRGESAVKDVAAVSGEIIENTCSDGESGISCIRLSDDFKGTTDKEAAFIGGPMVDVNGNVVGMRNIGMNNTQPELEHMTSADAIMKLLDDKNIPYRNAGSSSLPLSELAVGAGGFIIILAGLYFLKKKKGRKQSSQKPLPSQIESCDADIQTDGKSQQQTVLPESAATFAITGIQGVYQGQRFPIDDSIILGRDSNRCHIIFENTAGVSRVHCLLQIKHNDCILRDLHATYGTFLNQRRLADGEEVLLQDGDVFSLGNQENSFQLQKSGV